MKKLLIIVLLLLVLGLAAITWLWPDPPVAVNSTKQPLERPSEPSGRNWPAEPPGGWNGKG